MNAFDHSHIIAHIITPHNQIFTEKIVHLGTSRVSLRHAASLVSGREFGKFECMYQPPICLCNVRLRVSESVRVTI